MESHRIAQFKTRGEITCRLTFYDVTPPTDDMVQSGENLWSRSYERDGEQHYEFPKQTTSGTAVKIHAFGLTDLAGKMELQARSLIERIEPRKLAEVDSKQVYLSMRRKILPPVGISRDHVEAVFGSPDRRVTSTEPISNVPLPHHQYDVVSDGTKMYFLCVKYDDDRAAWIYLANMDDEGRPGDISGRSVDYPLAIRKLELLEVLYGDALKEASWRN